MTNNTLKSTIESLIASSALVVVTLDGTFNSKTGAPVLSARTRPDQRNAFLKQYCEKVNPADAGTASEELDNQIRVAINDAQTALSHHDFARAIKATQEAAALSEQKDQPRVYYRVKEGVDLRTVAEKRAAKKAENAEKKAAKQAEKEQKAADKMAAAVAAQSNAAPQSAEPTAAPVEITEAPAQPKKGGKKAA